jgi:ABC-type branched-subunit amino acid transport system substrate-binding protein
MITARVWVHRALPLLAAAAALSYVGCHIFESLHDCNVDSDCALGSVCDPGKFCTPANGPIVVGVLLPMSGQLATIGQSQAVMFQYAETAINAAAGQAGVAGGRPIHFEVQDDKGDTTLAVTLANAFIQQRVAAIIGPLTSPQAEAVEAVTGPAEVLEITQSAGATALQTAQPPTNRYFFQTITSIARGSAPTIAFYAQCGPVGHPPCERMAVLRSNDATGGDYGTAIAAYAALRGSTIVADVQVPSTQLDVSDYADASASLFAPNPDCSALIVEPEVACNFLRSVAQNEHPSPGFFWIGSTNLDTSGFISSCIDNATTDRALGVLGADIDYDPPRYQYADLLSAYNAATQQSLASLPALAANAFDAAAVVALAIARAGGVTDRVTIRDAVWDVANDGPQKPAFTPATLSDAFETIRNGSTINYTGASSDIEFDPYGVVSEGTVAWNVVHTDGGAGCDGSCDSIAILQHFAETLPSDMEAGTARCCTEAGADGACP